MIRSSGDPQTLRNINAAFELAENTLEMRTAATPMQQMKSLELAQIARLSGQEREMRRKKWTQTLEIITLSFLFKYPANLAQIFRD